MSLVVHGIGRLVTNSEAGEMEAAWVVIDGGRVAAVGTGVVPAADDALDVAGRAVLPGFVDSHTHLVFGGDRAEEFAARMAGAPYAAGGIVTTIEATRALDDDAVGDGHGGAGRRAAPRRRHHVRDQVRLRRHRR